MKKIFSDEQKILIVTVAKKHIEPKMSIEKLASVFEIGSRQIKIFLNALRFCDIEIKDIQSPFDEKDTIRTLYIEKVKNRLRKIYLTKLVQIVY